MQVFFAESALLTKWRSMKCENCGHFQPAWSKILFDIFFGKLARTEMNYHPNRNYDDTIKRKRALTLQSNVPKMEEWSSMV